MKPRSEPGHVDAIDREIAARVAHVVERRSQSEVARKVGVAQPRISGYIRGARIPASFCARLVTGLGVNPGWLLAGQGEPDGTRHNASNPQVAELAALLGDIERAGNVALAAALTTPGMRGLKLMSSQMGRVTALQSQLAAAFKGPAREAVMDARRALDGMDSARASVLLNNVTPLVTACADPDLSASHQYALGCLAMHKGLMAEAAEHCGRSATIRSIHGIRPELAELEALSSLAVVLANEGRTGRARALYRVADAAGSGAGLPRQPGLDYALGVICVVEGRLTEAQAPLHGAAAGLRGDDLQLPKALLSVVAVCNGTRDLDEELYVLRGLRPSRGEDVGVAMRASACLSLALFAGEPDQLREAIVCFTRHFGTKAGGTVSPWLAAARAMVQATSQPRQAVYDEFARALPVLQMAAPTDASADYRRHVMCAVVAEACGSAALGKELVAAATARKAIPAGETAKVLTGALHAKTVLRAAARHVRGQKTTHAKARVSAGEQAWACEYLDGMVARGFGALRKWRELVPGYSDAGQKA